MGNFSRIIPEKPRNVLFILIILIVSSSQGLGWGFWAHKEINRRAIRLLPPAMKNFFLVHADSIAEHSVDPDLKRSFDSLEQYNHYIDIDYYGKYPFNELPRNYDSARAKFGAETVRKQGLVPWRIAAFTDSLRNAMKQNNQQAILHFAAELGHYVADSHVPLHTVMDYDGVQRGQRGVHKRWESDLTERFGQSYRFPTKGIFSIKNPLKYAFRTILESYTYTEAVFAADARALQVNPYAKKMESIRENGDTVYTFSDGYYESLKIYDGRLAENRMQKAIVSLASYWYTAWINAGKPALRIEKSR